MLYHALLYCPDEKSARTLTQILNDLDFSVEAATGPSAATNQLKEQSFDAVVVDCDDEHNATLLFKGVHDSASRHAPLAVAVVQGQTDPAHAFRFGADLILTKPIHIEQWKTTLRAARGLLRKNEIAKATAANTASATPGTTMLHPAADHSSSAEKSQAPVESAAISTSDSSVPGTNSTAFSALPTPTANTESASCNDPSSNTVEEKRARQTGSTTSFGAATAPAKSSAHPNHPAEAPLIAANVTPIREAKSAAAKPASTAGSVKVKSSESNRKVVLGIAAAVLLAVAAYVGWRQYQEFVAPPVSRPAPTQQGTPPSRQLT
jgi:DNA-binding response OmpR family regulator